VRDVAMTDPRENRIHLSQQMLQNLEKLQLPIEELRKRIEEELQSQDGEGDQKDQKTD
jgi:DNA repair protein RadC